MISIPSKRHAAMAGMLALAFASVAGPALAQGTPAKELFGARRLASAQAPGAYGFYSRGCVAGAVEMPRDGATWQVMKVSRHRAWGHPAMIDFLQKLSRKAAAEADWRGLLFGDIAQPRGGPMTSGHASHQVGLDADIYLTEMPNRRLSNAERDSMDLPSVIDARTRRVAERRWRPEMLKLIRAAAEERQVQRIFVHPGIKQKLCATAGDNRSWLNKVRPMYGHDYHFHVRLYCQPGEPGCEAQETTGKGDGCGDLDYWFNVALKPPKPPKPGAKPPKPRPPLTMAALPKACNAVLNAPDATDGTYVATRPETPRPMALVGTPQGIALPFEGIVPVPSSRPLRD